MVCKCGKALQWRIISFPNSIHETHIKPFIRHTIQNWRKWLLVGRNFPAGTEVQPQATRLSVKDLSDLWVQPKATGPYPTPREDVNKHIKAFTCFFVENKHHKRLQNIIVLARKKNKD